MPFRNSNDDEDADAHTQASTNTIVLTPGQFLWVLEGDTGQEVVYVGPTVVKLREDDRITGPPEHTPS